MKKKKNIKRQKNYRCFSMALKIDKSKWFITPISWILQLIGESVDCCLNKESVISLAGKTLEVKEGCVFRDLKPDILT